MFQPFPASKTSMEKLFIAASEAPLFNQRLLGLADGIVAPLPKGFAHDFSSTDIGRGPDAFQTARAALQRWQQFDLGWVKVANPSANIAIQELVAVEAHTMGLWSINFSRIAEVIDSPTRFGFLYTTTTMHVEEGQERFVIELDPDSGLVSYLIEAVSRPQHFLARIGYPVSRAMQHRFARESHARIKDCVIGNKYVRPQGTHALKS